MDEEEDEIWDYKSIKRVKRNGCQQTKPPTKDSNSKASSSSNKKKKATKLKKNRKTPEEKEKAVCNLSKTIHTPEKPKGVCPNCQVPLACLGILSPSWHVTECLESGSQPSVECPDGMSCTNTIESHYRQFSHYALALARCTNKKELTDGIHEEIKPAKISRKELKFPNEDTQDLIMMKSNVKTETVMEPNHVSDAESEDLLSQRSLSDILDAAQSDSDIDKVSSDGESDNNDKDWWGLSLETGGNANSQMSQDGRTIKAGFSSEEDEMEEVKKLKKDDIFNEDNSTLCFSSQDESIGVDLSCALKGKKWTTCTVKISLSSGLKKSQNEHSEYEQVETHPEDMVDEKDIYSQGANNGQNLESPEGNTDDKEVHCISDSDSDFQDCKDSVSLSQKARWAKMFTPQKCSLSSESSQNSSGRKSLSQKSTSSKKSSARKRTSLPASLTLSQKSSEKKKGLPPKANSGKKRENCLNAEVNLPKPIIKSESMEKHQLNMTTELKNKNKQTSLTSFFLGKSIRSSDVQQKDQSLSRNVMSTTDMDGDSSCKTYRKATDKSSRTALNEVTNKVKGSKRNSLVPPVDSVSVLRRSPRSHGSGPSTEDRSHCSDGMTASYSTKVCKDVDPSPTVSTNSACTPADDKSTKPNAMEFLMSKQKKPKPQPVKNSVSEASISELTVPTAGKQQENANRYQKRSCPFYKKIPDTGFTVDAFSYGVIPGCTGYILSHFHYDHYTGMTKSFSQPVYCSKITANLVISKIKVKESFVHTLPLNEATVVNGVELTFLEANHCPGSVLILFKLRDGRAFLHTGDFRADPSMEKYPALRGVGISQLYLDTTYCNPTYAFPPQSEVIDFTVNLVRRELQRNPSTLIVCGSYTIGKERIFIAVADALGCKICVMRDKKNVLDCLEDISLRERISLNFTDSCLHVLPMNKLNPKALLEHSGKLKPSYGNILAIEPTGWTFSKVSCLQEIRPKYNRDGIKIYGIPYSEHSSYLELQRFVQFVKPGKIIPTVNVGNPASRAKMNQIFEEWRRGMTKVQKKNNQTSISAWACQ